MPSAKLPGQAVLVLQGGGALGAYQVGVYEALHEAGLEPDWAIGTSIGAINAAVIAGNRREDRLPRLLELWQRFEQGDAGALDHSKVFGDFAALLWGIPGFFSPRLPAWGGLKAKVGLDSASYYSLRHLVRELTEDLSAEKQEQYRELASWACATTMHVVRLCAPALEDEDFTKDLDFSAASIRFRREAGRADTRRMLERAPWRAPVDPMEGVIVHELSARTGG